MIAKKRNKDWECVQRLIDIQEELAFDLDKMVTVVMTDLHEEPYTFDEVHNVALSITRKLDFRFFHFDRSADLPGDYLKQQCYRKKSKLHNTLKIDY